MSDGTKIEWTDATWQIITGCSVVSPGCTNCYAMKLAGGRLRHHPSRAGLTVDMRAGPVWTGEVRFNHQWLDQPLRWRRPRRIFVCAHGDLFHEAVPDHWIDQVFAVMALCPQHIFQVLTKRAPRMRAYLGNDDVAARTCRAAESVDPPSIHVPQLFSLHGYDADRGVDGVPTCWPLPNVHVGVSVEDQERANERIPVLLETPAAVRWVSAEPLLGPINLTDVDIDGDYATNALRRCTEREIWKSDWCPEATGTSLEEAVEGFTDEGFRYPPSDHRPRGLDHVIVGGESGPGARIGHIDWHRSLIRQCQAAGVPVFEKQLGRRVRMNCSDAVQPVGCGAGWDAGEPGSPEGVVEFRDRKGGDMIEWPPDLRVREELAR